MNSKKNLFIGVTLPAQVIHQMRSAPQTQLDQLARDQRIPASINGMLDLIGARVWFYQDLGTFGLCLEKASYIIDARAPFETWQAAIAELLAREAGHCGFNI